ncbi:MULTISPECIES: class I SAM-dependent methyltransferase [unclassified Aureimonas]|uniref:class I SAM-dependent methyltransferase n=1 Tax=unclassified Aureimonas TaxID=2615206 RepID=UPI0006F28368|nr:MULTISPECIES: class I SAM-dependent methyltransferase [unclassified Aureimonas]KQT52821.1 methyltransferase [Aureimonas sp. Leaf427]KQT80281.1 methyltransferase [Aureimonas sp. Leaf460]
MEDGWNESAEGWIEAQGVDGDWGRRFVLDRPMMARVTGRDFIDAIDIGCGEGRFCRMLRRSGLRPVGIDPTAELIERARRLDPDGDYRIGKAEALNVADQSFDLAVSYLSLIDIPDLPRAISEFNRVLRPGGTLLIANLQSFNTAGPPKGWTREADETQRFYIDDYLDERAQWVEWGAIKVLNWHWPLKTYMKLLLEAGLQLRHFDEPEPVEAEQSQTDRYRRAPYFLIMEWQKPS